MADAEIRLTADASGAKGELVDLRSKIDAMLERLGATGEVSKVAGDVLEEVFQNAGLSAQEATNALTALEEKHKSNAQAAGEHSLSLSSLSKSFLGTISVVAILKANYDDLKPSIDALGKAFREQVIEMGASQDAADLFANSLEMMVNPFTIVENLTENLKIATRAYADEVVGATNAEINYNLVSTDKVEKLKAVLKAQQDLVRQEEENTKATEIRAEALAREIASQKANGEVSKFLRDQLRALLDQYDRMGEKPPENVRALAEELKVLSGEQERSAKAAEREAAALEKQAAGAAKTTEATKPLVEAKREHSEISEIAARFLELENEQLEENARLAIEAAEAARQKFEADQARIAELQGKPTLDVGEANELADLTAGQAGSFFEYGEAAQEAEAAQVAVNEAQQQQIDLGADLNKVLESTTELTREQAEALGDIGNVDLGGAYREGAQELDNFANRQGEVTQQAERFGEVWEYTNERGEEVITNFTDELGVLEGGLGDAENAAGGFADAMGDIAREGGQIGDQVARGAEKATTEVDRMLEGQKAVNAELEISVQLARELAQALANAADQV